jgi:hypothetical protein
VLILVGSGLVLIWFFLSDVPTLTLLPPFSYLRSVWLVSLSWVGSTSLSFLLIFLCSFECPEWEFNLHSPLSKYVGFRYPQAHTKKNFKSLNFPNLVRLVPFSCKISPETVWFWFWLWDCSSPLLFFLLRKFK